MKKLIKHVLQLKKLLGRETLMAPQETFELESLLKNIDEDIKRLCNDSFSEEEDEELKELLLLQDPICSKHHG